MLVQLEEERRGRRGKQGGSGIRITDEKRYVCVCMRACAFYIHVDGDDQISHPGWEC